eukprot:TRINITY_DN2267_c0_g1_i1.p3 TRINITY_DN2267_c0_g1~~TRINITY_DN2267_c0_g1_i1.p3  ORF type:complete len:125 (+),score=26.55 TRINITY_DN2267_c0_g1_i1:800-1174(+)
MSAKVKTFELRGKKPDELLAKVNELKKELATLRVAQVTGGNAAKLGKINTVRKSIARVNTVVNQTRKAELRKHFAKSKYVPKDLRAKKTRALRRRLTPTEFKKVTLKQFKKLSNNVAPKYYVKA